MTSIVVLFQNNASILCVTAKHNATLVLTCSKISDMWHMAAANIPTTAQQSANIIRPIKYRLFQFESFFPLKLRSFARYSSRMLRSSSAEYLRGVLSASRASTSANPMREIKPNR